MIQRPPHKLYASERPVQSDYAMERSYAKRRIATLAILAAIVGGVSYAVWGGGDKVLSSDIPTIKAEGEYRKKPDDPGGVEIPHQDVKVYEQLEGKTGAAYAPVEHLLPPPEAPKVETPAPEEAKQAAAPEIDTNKNTEKMETTVKAATPPATSAVGTATPSAAPVNTQPAAKKEVIKSVPAVPVAAESKPKENKEKEAAPSFDSVLNKVKQQNAEEKATSTAPVAVASGNVAIQLASVPSEAQADTLASQLQKKYASILGEVSLRVVRADLGAKGIYYRIQGQGLSSADADRICSSIKQTNAGCMLVRK